MDNWGEHRTIAGFLHHFLRQVTVAVLQQSPSALVAQNVWWPRGVCRLLLRKTYWHAQDYGTFQLGSSEATVL
jgi:hypothetical protein